MVRPHHLPRQKRPFLGTGVACQGPRRYREIHPPKNTYPETPQTHPQHTTLTLTHTLTQRSPLHRVDVSCPRSRCKRFPWGGGDTRKVCNCVSTEWCRNGCPKGRGAEPFTPCLLLGPRTRRDTLSTSHSPPPAPYTFEF